MKRKKLFLIVFLLIVMPFFCIILNAQNQIVIKPTPSNGKFCYLNSYNYYANAKTESLIAATWTYDGSFGIGRSFFWFDLPELPAGASNLKVVLNLYYNPESSHVGHGGENACKLERIISEWDESDVNWDNQPQVDNSLSVLLPTSLTTSQDYPGIDVTTLVEAMVANPQSSFGFRISLLTEDVYRSMVLSSCNHGDESLRPSLVISYDSCSLPVENFDFDVTGMLCQFNYSDTTTTEWHWNFGDNTSSSLQNPEHTYTSSGSYIVNLTAINPCGRTSITDTVVICNLPVSDFTYRTDGQIVTFASLASGAETWYWSFGNGFFSNRENPVYHYLEAGTFDVCLMVTNRCGSDLYCTRLTIEAPTQPQSAGIDFGIETSPNPTSGVVKLTAANEETIVRVDISNTSGRLLASIEPDKSKDITLDLTNLEAGAYLVKVVTSQGDFTKLIIKR